MTNATTAGLERRLIDRLQSLAQPNQPDRAALAVLRRSLSGAPGSEFDVYRHLPFLASVPDRDERWYRLVAGLFALHQRQVQEGERSLGHAFRAAVRSEDDREAVERRFVTLLKAHRDDLPTHLRSAVSFLKARDVAIDYVRLLRDLRVWETPDSWVQRRWARDFWGTLQDADAGERDTVENDDQDDNEQ